MTLNQSEDSNHFVPGEHGLSSVSSFPIPRKVAAVGRACAPPPSLGPPWPFFSLAAGRLLWTPPRRAPPPCRRCRLDTESARLMEALRVLQPLPHWANSSTLSA